LPRVPASTPPPPYIVEVTLVASGDVSDYTDSVRASIVDSFAAAANVPASSVRLTVTSGSVRLSLSIAAATLAAAQTVEAALAPVLSSAANASALLPPSLSVTATPVVQLIDSSQSTPPVAVAPRLVSGSVPVGAIIAIAVAVGVVALGTALWFALRAGWCKRVQATVDAMPPKCANSPKTQTSMEHTNGIQTVSAESSAPQARSPPQRSPKSSPPLSSPHNEASSTRTLFRVD
jgi:hypothetical protein